MLLTCAMADTAEPTATTGEASDARDPNETPKKRKLPSTMDEKLAEAVRLKGEGNELFKAGNYKKAITRYSKVFAYTWVPGNSVKQYATGGEGQEVTEEQVKKVLSRSVSPHLSVFCLVPQGELVRELKVACWGNIAQCHLKLEAPRECVKFCKKILEEEEGGEDVDAAVLPPAQKVKALVRMGQAMLMLNDLDKAKAHLTEAHTLDPKNAGVRSQWKKLQAAFKEHKAKEKSKFGGMFSS